MRVTHNRNKEGKDEKELLEQFAKNCSKKVTKVNRIFRIDFYDVLIVNKLAICADEKCYPITKR